jgi:uncharacterized repeat protein (TIGR01451 family)
VIVTAFRRQCGYRLAARQAVPPAPGGVSYVALLRGTRMRKLAALAVAATAALAGLVPASQALAAGTSTGADLQVSGSSNLGSPVQGQPYVYTYQVKNSGPQDATSTTFTDDLTAGTFVYALVNGFSAPCSHTSDGATGTAISCNLFTVAKGGQATVTVSVNAPSTIGPFANTATATSTDVADPQPTNNASTVTVKVSSAACPLPAGQPTVTGVVAWKLYDSNGFLAGFHLYGNDGVQYTALLNLFAAPLTNTINLLCKPVPADFYIQVSASDTVTGPIDMEILPGDTVATPVIHASVVQTPYWVDKVA